MNLAVLCSLDRKPELEMADLGDQPGHRCKKKEDLLVGRDLQGDSFNKQQRSPHGIQVVIHPP